MARIIFFTDDRSVYFTESSLSPEDLVAKINTGRDSLDLANLNLPAGKGRLVAFRYSDLVIVAYADQPGLNLSRSGKDDLTLTGRERQILQALSEGLTAKRIGEELGLKQRTIREYIHILKYKFHAQTTEQAVARGVVLGLCQPHSHSDSSY